MFSWMRLIQAVQYFQHERTGFHHAHCLQAKNNSGCTLDSMSFEECCLFESSLESTLHSEIWGKPGFLFVGVFFFFFLYPPCTYPACQLSCWLLPHPEDVSYRLCLRPSASAGYVLALGPLVFVSVFDVWLAKFTTGQAYVVNLVSVGVVAFGCTGTTSLTN